MRERKRFAVASNADVVVPRIGRPRRGRKIVSPKSPKVLVTAGEKNKNKTKMKIKIKIEGEEKENKKASMTGKERG